MAEREAKQMVTGAEEIGLAREMAGETTGDLATGGSDMTRAELSGVVAVTGVVDIAEGAELFAASEDVATLSAIVGLMGEEDLQRGLARHSPGTGSAAECWHLVLDHPCIPAVGAADQYSHPAGKPEPV